MGRKKVRHSEIVPNKNEWPIVKLSRDRKEFIDEVTAETYNHLIEGKGGSLREEIEMTIHREKLRMKANPWRVDPPDERVYWKNMQARLLDINPDEKEKAIALEKELLSEIINRYTQEIAGSFKRSAYQFAQKFITFGFARLLNAARVKGLLSLFSRQLDLDDKIHVIGETEHIRSLAKKGTVVMVPTHFSNLDSILIGWAIQYLGLPPFIYGAGLNLFNIKILAYFMNSLGAYKVDRRKKNPIYLETLKTYSRNAIKKGCHSLFFPGGTRSRSGEIETNLRTGLLGTAIEAQRELYLNAGENEDVRKVFIVPVVINYHFTLEAPSLIRDHLKRTGRERYYVEADEFSTSYKLGTFMFKFFTKGSDISVNVGRGMDILGNYVDDDGNSFDKNGNAINVKDYFLRDKKITFDAQREKEYVRVLSKRIVEEYHKYNRVFASHLVAFTAFKMLERKNPKLDLYSVLRLPDEDLVLDYEEFKDNFKKLRTRLEKIHKKGQVDMADHMKKKATNAIEHGLQNVGLYHDQRPLIRKGDKIIVQDTNTLYYYHNRMNGYGLEKYI
ncbi:MULTISPECIES: 1-acyl-sn-glycerol-3-phosphate acyltransferase [unclassified Ekhidna]|jgi:glycerol-3-phosphate O-acyltransferase|uniref:1-acyl-sn-glycerol-3-phosphate acyltransferase n=1 Tax=unclassified Ekhidna TaxID=2632188 RepID=UPI0032E0007E